MIKNRAKRPAIPLKTQMKLWTLSAGRCEFLGCNNLLWRDSLTFTEGNYSNIAHIISWTPTGPRGDLVLSPKLAREIDNLMLLCAKHAKMIDEKKNVSKYPIDLLRSFKKLHEERIRIQTDIKESRKTTVVRLQTNIQGRRVEIPQSDVYSGLIAENRYPGNEKGILIDLTNLDYSSDHSFWDTAKRQIDSGIERELARGNDELRHTHFSIFGLAPIPLLVYLGFKIGNIIPSDVYIKVRNMNWRLGEASQKQPQKRFIINRPKITSKPQDIVLSISVSGANSTEDIKKAVGGRDFPIYELRLANPGLDKIRSAKELELFRSSYRSILDEIREQCGQTARVHLLAAVPSCAAIVCGREILHGVDPPLVVYEHGDQASGFFRAVEVN